MMMEINHCDKIGNLDKTPFLYFLMKCIIVMKMNHIDGSLHGDENSSTLSTFIIVMRIHHFDEN